MAKLKELAARLGLSTATVSRALNDKPGVNPEVRQRVLELATQVNYAPNVAARGLVTGYTRTVGLLWHTPVPLPLTPERDPYSVHIMHAVEHALTARGYYLMMSSVEPCSLKEAGDLGLWRENRVDGLIVVGPWFTSQFVLSLKMTGIPLVLIDNALPRSPVDCVLADDEAAGYAAAQHLLGHGHRRIVMLSGPTDWSSCAGRYQGYQRAMADAGLAATRFCQDATTLESGHAAMLEALDQAPDMSGIVAANDVMALGAMRAAQERGCRVPDDIGFVGVDDVWWSAHNRPSLTTIRIPWGQAGTLAAQRLIEIMEHKQEAPIRIALGVELILRESCGCAAALEAGNSAGGLAMAANVSVASV